MIPPTLLALAVGLVGAVLGVYYREAVRLVLRKKLLATKLEAQIGDLLRDYFESEFQSVMVAAFAWNKEREKAFREGGVEGFLKVD